MTEMAPTGTETVSEPLVSDPPVGPIGMLGPTGVSRASIGTVPTPDCTEISRSTATVAGTLVDKFATVLTLKKRCELSTGIEYRPLSSEVSSSSPPTTCTVAPSNGNPFTSDKTCPTTTPAATTWIPRLELFAFPARSLTTTVRVTVSPALAVSGILKEAVYGGPSRVESTVPFN